jgi:hypothetical protein
MTDTDVEVVPEDRKRQVTRVLQAVIAAVMAYGVVTLQGGMVLNAGIGLAVTFLPALLRRDFSVPMDPALTLGITMAVLVHAVGTLGPYTAWGWYDQVAHFISAAVVAAAGYATAKAIVIHEEDAHVPPPYMFVFILVFVLAFGVLWEILEFALEGVADVLGADAPLTQYGVDDTVLDLVADAVGGLAVAVWGTARLSGFAQSLADRLSS